MRTPPKWLGNTATILIVAFCAWIYVRMNIVIQIPWLPEPSDSSAYFNAGRDILQGKSPYSDPVFFYPPLLPFLMVPLALVNYIVARWIWFILAHLCVLGAGVLLWRAMGKGRLALCCIACVWALGGAFKETLRQGQLNSVLLLVLVLAYTERGRLRGTFAGLGFALKYFPGIVMLPLLLARRWRALAIAALAGFGAVFIPWLVIGTLFQGALTPVSATYWMGTPSMFSWGVPSLVLRLLTPITRGAPFPPDWEFGNVAATLHLDPRLAWISVGSSLAVLLGGVIALVVICRGRLSDRQIPWAMSGLVALSLAIAPVSWSHYQLMQYPGVAMVAIVAIRRGYWFVASAAALCFAMVWQLPQYFLVQYNRMHHGWTTASPSTVYFWTSVPPLATLTLFALALVMLRREEE